MNLLDFAVEEAARQGIDPQLVLKVIQAESGGRASAVSPKGARGPMQLMPDTAKAMGVNIDDPLDNIRGGVRYLGQQLKDFGSADLALAAYNAGPGNVRKHGGVPPFAETQAYVGKIMGNYGQAANDDSDIFGTTKKSLSGSKANDDSDIFAIAPRAETPKAIQSAPRAVPSLSSSDKFIQGMRDPIDGGAQLLTNILPKGVVEAGNNLNNWLADKTGLVGKLPAGGVDQQVREREQAYQQQREAQGESGIDGYRMLGNIASPANLAISSRVVTAGTLPARIAAGSGVGALSGALAPVAGDDYSGEKMAQIGAGAAFGGAVPVAAAGLQRLISPAASTNPNLALLKSKGVTPTVGQTIGGRFNALEEKLQSIPILGDAIAAARGKSLDQFNRAAINRAVAPVGAKAEGTGFEAVKKAGDTLSDAYDSALSQVKHITFDNQFGTDLAQLKAMASNLTPSMQSKFDKLLNDNVTGRMSPNGSMLGDVYKKVDSELGQIAKKWQKSSMASESEFGDAVAQLQSLLNQQMRRSNPQVADTLNAIDAGWANLVRLEGAAKSGINAEGMFTPAQLNAAIRQTDQSTRGRSVSRGTALMQDLGNAGQQVLGNKVPNSFTTDRALIAGGALGSYFVNPAIPAGLVGGAALYASPVQKLLNAALSSRPQFAGLLSDKIGQAAPALVPGGMQIPLGLLDY